MKNPFRTSPNQIEARRLRELGEARNELMTAQAQLERAKHNVALFTERVARLDASASLDAQLATHITAFTKELP